MKNVASIQSTFQNRCFKIPDYQRGYAWEEPNWQDLWEDIEYLSKGKDHYTGNLVLNPTDAPIASAEGNRQEVFEVVDGQQRLTTLVILLKCLHTVFNSSRHQFATGIEISYLWFKDGNGQMRPRLELNADCAEFFRSDIIGDNASVAGSRIASHMRLSGAKKFFSDKIANLKRILDENDFQSAMVELHNKITQRLKLGEQQVDDSTDVGVIFEVMNNRGKSLSELEKVKNYLLYVTSKLQVDENDLCVRINATWSKIFETLMKAGLTSTDMENRLLRSHWLMAFDPDRRNWDGSKSIKSRFHLRRDSSEHRALLGELIDYVDSLGNSVVAFCDAIAPTRSGAFGSFPRENRTEIVIWSEKLARTGARASFLPALMAARARHATDAAAYLAIVQAFELFEFRVFRWAGCRSHAGQTRLIRIGFDLFHNSLKLEAAATEIREKALGYSANKAFEEGFEITSENNFYRWGGIRYFLYEYELDCAGKKGARIRWDEISNMEPQKTIEHILPQTPDDPYWKDRFSEEEIESHTHALGNLCLTMDNSSYKNFAFTRKCGDAQAQRPCYAQSKLFSEQRLARDFQEWTPKTIAIRQQDMKQWALARWKIESSTSPAEVDIDEEIQAEEESPE